MDLELTGKFHITRWDETNYAEDTNGARRCQASITLDYTGDLQGSSEIRYLMSYQSAASAFFVGHELISARIGERQGSFVLQHNGTFENGVASSAFAVIPGSGKGDFVDLEGEGSFVSAEQGTAKYEFELCL